MLFKNPKCFYNNIRDALVIFCLSLANAAFVVLNLPIQGLFADFLFLSLISLGGGTYIESELRS